MALLQDNYIGNKMAGFRLNVLILIVTIAFQFVWFLVFLSILLRGVFLYTVGAVSFVPSTAVLLSKEIAVISHGVNETKVCSSIFLSFLILVCRKKSAFLRTNFPSI